MSYFKSVVELLDLTLSTKRKRHIVGGSLLGVALLFGALAITAMTAQEEEDSNEWNNKDRTDIGSGNSDWSSCRPTFDEEEI
jgi:hypothetical protein